MGEFIEISWTVGSIDEARRTARTLVQEKLVADAHIIPWLESIYLFRNQLETDQESLVTARTKKKHLEKICEIVKKNSKFDVPEILWHPLEGINPEYQAWLEESL